MVKLTAKATYSFKCIANAENSHYDHSRIPLYSAWLRMENFQIGLIQLQPCGWFPHISPCPPKTPSNLQFTLGILWTGHVWNFIIPMCRCHSQPPRFDSFIKDDHMIANLESLWSALSYLNTHIFLGGFWKSGLRINQEYFEKRTR